MELVKAQFARYKTGSGGSMSNLTGRAPFQKGQPAPSRPSAPLRKAAQGEACTLRLAGCLPGTETVVLAHLRFFSWAGMAGKPDDLLAVFACASCHDQLDRRTAPTWGWDDVLRGLGETLLRHKAAGRISINGGERRDT